MGSEDDWRGRTCSPLQTERGLGEGQPPVTPAAGPPRLGLGSRHGSSLPAPPPHDLMGVCVGGHLAQGLWQEGPAQAPAGEAQEPWGYSLGKTWRKEGAGVSPVLPANELPGLCLGVDRETTSLLEV